MRAPPNTIAAPPFPIGGRWLSSTPLTVSQLQGRPVLIEFWDFCRPNSMRTLPYIKAWHERYRPPISNGEPAGDGLHVIGVHSPGFPPSRNPDAVAAAVTRLGIDYPVLVDSELDTWRTYENLGWPARYLFDRQGLLFDYHYGEGAYLDTELAIQTLLATPRGKPRPETPDLSGFPEPLAPLRPEDAPGAMLVAQTQDIEGPYSGPYEAGGVWVVLDGAGSITLSGMPAPEGESSDPVGSAARSGDSSKAGPHAALPWAAHARPSRSAHAPTGTTPSPTDLDTRVTLRVTEPGAYPLIEHPHHTAGTLAMELTGTLTCLATCFTPGLAQEPTPR